MNNLEMEVMYGEKAAITEKTTMSMKEMCDMIQGVMLDEFMKISENDMREMYPDVLWYCDTDILVTRNVMKNLETDLESPEEKKERERESYRKYKEFVMKKKGHKGGFR